MNKTNLMILFFIILFSLFTIDCKEKHKCDTECQLELFWVFYGQDYLRANTPCATGYNLTPGSNITLQLPSSPATTEKSFYMTACSPNSWTFTVTPSAGIKYTIIRLTPPNCFNNNDLITSIDTSSTTTLTGNAGCVNGTSLQVLEIFVNGPANSTFNVNFN